MFVASSYVPSTWQIFISGDIIFDETFYSAIATTWHQFHDALALCSTESYIPDPTRTLETTGSINMILPMFEEEFEQTISLQTSPVEDEVIFFDAPIQEDDDAQMSMLIHTNEHNDDDSDDEDKEDDDVFDSTTNDDQLEQNCAISHE